MDNGTSQMSQDDLRKTYGGMLTEIGALESAVGSTYKVAAGWLNSQDFAEVDTSTADLEQFLNSAIHFVSEVQRDVGDLQNLLAKPRDHQETIESISRALERLAESQGTTLKALNQLANAESRRELVFRQDVADATVRFLDAVKGYVDRAARIAVELLEGWDRVESQANSRAVVYAALETVLDTITALVAHGNAACNVVSTDANPALISTKNLLQAHGWRHGQSNDLLATAMQQERLFKHFDGEARKGLSFEAGLQQIDTKAFETFGEGGPLHKLCQRIRAQMDWLDDLGFQFPVRIGELAPADERF